MEIIANYWWAWVLTTALSFGCTTKVMFRAMKAVDNSNFAEINSSMDEIILPILLGTSSFFLMAIGILLKLAK